MKKQYFHFVPKTDTGRGYWAKNVREKISVIGPLLGLDAPWITKVEAAALNIETTVGTVEAFKTDLERATAAKNRSKIEDVQVIADAAAIMKRHPDYQEELGSALGIVGYAVSLNPKDMKPIIKVRSFEGKVEVSFNLQQMSSVAIFSRLKGTNGWKRLGTDFESPFIDTTPLANPLQPEVREYSAMYFNRREDVGQRSDIATVVFAG